MKIEDVRFCITRNEMRINKIRIHRDMYNEKRIKQERERAKVRLISVHVTDRIDN